MEMSAMGYRNINSHNRWGIIISSGLMAITLIVSWILWLMIFRTNIDDVLTVLNMVIGKQGIKIKLTFQLLTIIILIFAVVTLIVITIPFLFLNKYGIIVLILSLLMLIVSSAVLAGSALLVKKGYQDFSTFIASKKIINLLFFIVPCGVTLICCLLLVIFCLWLVIANLLSKTKKENNNRLAAIDSNHSSPFTMSSTSNEQNSPFNDQHITPSIFTERLANETEKLPQGINIVINNTGRGDLPQTKLLDNQATNSSNPIQNNNPVVSNPVVNSEVIWTSEQIEEAWNKAEIIDNYNPQLYRKDYAGALMFKNSFINSVKLNDDPKSYNWTIVYHRPLLHGGTCDISNLQPMNNTNAITKANNYPRWKTAITFDGKQNFLKQKSWKDKKR